MVGAYFDGNPFCNVPVWIDHLICPVFQQEFGLDVPRNLADDIRGTKVFEQAGDFQTVLEIGANADKTDVEVIDAEALQHVFLGAVCDFRAGDNREDVLQVFLQQIHGHDIVAIFRQIHA